MARAVASRWGGGATTGEHLDGSSIHRLDRDRYFVRRPGLHLEDDGLDGRLPPALAAQRPTLVFPSIHRSESGLRCFTVHPLGNLGPTASLGGQPRALTPCEPRAMTAVLRELLDRGAAVGLPATYEATHHGPQLGLPAFFVEVAVAELSRPGAEEIEVIDQAIRAHRPDLHDRVALAVGGGHYAPRFTDLAKARRWAFGHIVPRHALAEVDRRTAEAAYGGTVGAEGVLFARAQDRTLPALQGIGPELKEGDAPRRTAPGTGPSGPSLPSSGT